MAISVDSITITIKGNVPKKFPGGKVTHLKFSYDQLAEAKESIDEALGLFASGHLVQESKDEDVPVSGSVLTVSSKVDPSTPPAGA